MRTSVNEWNACFLKYTRLSQVFAKWGEINLGAIFFAAVKNENGRRFAKQESNTPLFDTESTS